MNLLVTGTAGFIGSAFVRMLLGHQDHPKKPYPTLGAQDRLVSLDLLTYSGCLDNLNAVKNEARHTFVKGDIGDRNLVNRLVSEYNIDTLVNFAAESHVDRSIEGAEVFAQTNVMGTLNLLEVARKNQLKFLQVSTDEVYGSLGDEGTFTEDTPIAPNSPYSASKAAADGFVRAYVHAHKLDAIITRCSNNYGPFQFPEKFLPVAITKLMQNQKVPVYGTGKNVRDWLHVEDHCYGIWLALTKGRSGEVYNIGGHGERQNLEVLDLLLKAFGRSRQTSVQFVEDRKGHDWRYSMDPAKVTRELGWKAHWDLEEGLKHLVHWHRDNESWWRSNLPPSAT